MQPFFSSFQPQLSNQVQSSGNNAPVNPQVFPMHSSLANSMPAQPQLGLMSNHIQIPHNNSNTQFGNGQIMPNLPLLMSQQPGFLSTFNPLGVPQMGQCHMGFPLQNHVKNHGVGPVFMNQVNPYQAQGQVFAANFSNLPQQLNPSMCFPNSLNPMQNVNPGVPMQIPNPSQAFTYNGPPATGSHQVVGPHNLNLFANPMFGTGLQVNPNQQNVVIPTATQLVQGNSSTLDQTQNTQSSAFMNHQGNHVKNGKSGTSNCKWKNIPGKDFTRNPRKEASQLRYQKSHIHHMDNRKRKFGFSNEHKGKGHGYDKAAKFGHTNPSPANHNKETGRSLALTYTEQEIKQWREERRKNYPSKSNIEKKRTKKLTDSRVIDREAKLRREQLKEILARQAELGVEVAEIPPSYLSDADKQVRGSKDDRRFLTKGGRFHNKDKRGRYKKNDQFVKKQNSIGKDSSNISSLNKRNPTLLQKLLSADIRRDKHRLLQVFRFMVLNSFFKDWPEKPLKFPLVVVKEDGCEDEVVEGKSLFVGKDGFEAANEKGDDDDDNSNNANEYVAQVERNTCFGRRKGSLIVEVNRTEEEEGEIID